MIPPSLSLSVSCCLSLSLLLSCCHGFIASSVYRVHISSHLDFSCFKSLVVSGRVQYFTHPPFPLFFSSIFMFYFFPFFTTSLDSVPFALSSLLSNSFPSTLHQTSQSSLNFPLWASWSIQGRFWVLTLSFRWCMCLWFPGYSMFRHMGCLLAYEISSGFRDACTVHLCRECTSCVLPLQSLV